jgi:hypothetical protein
MRLDAREASRRQQGRRARAAAVAEASGRAMQRVAVLPAIVP